MKTTEVNLKYYTPHHTTVHSTAGLFMLTQITDWMNGLIDWYCSQTEHWTVL